MKKKIVVGMSGGVDSSVCAYLLKEQGWDVIGVTMRLWDEEEDPSRPNHVGCCGTSAAEDAMRVAGILGIPFHMIDFKEKFRKDVVDYFNAEYLRGRTPNPCIACNRYLKWGAMLAKAKELGAEHIATGHYARIDLLENGRYALRGAASAKKDQTYVLYQLTQEQLAHTQMPVGEYDKAEVRRIAEKIGLPVAAKKDSQDICFIPDGDYGVFLEKEIPEKLPGEGDFKDGEGNVVGRHKGITHYTIGQRKGLGIALGHPVFVNRIDPVKNEVVVGTNEECFSKELSADRLAHMSEERFDPEKTYTAKIRYSHGGAPARVSYEGEDLIRVTFEEPVRAVTPGQAVVLYDGDHVAGGGVIR